MRFGRTAFLVAVNHYTEPAMQITRKEFLGRLLGSAAGMVGVAMVVGCGNSSNNGGGEPDAGTPSGGGGPDAARAASCAMNGTTSLIGANHGHVLMVSKADVAAGAAKTYDIRGAADHPHSVTVTAAMFTTLQASTAITAVSTTNSSHDHPITVMCV
jgi:hypothetical protein